MNAIASIIAASDFSAPARHAADRAARIAQETHAALTLLHVVPGPLMSQVRAWLGTDTEVEARLVDEARGKLAELMGRLTIARPVQVDALVKEGSVRDEILREADRLDARLIVLGALGSGILRRLVIGTTAGRLVRSTSRPVLVVRQTPRERYRRVLVAVDFSDWSDGALQTARWVAPHAHLVLASVFQVPFGGRLRLAGVDEATLVRFREQARADALRRLHALAARAALPPGRWEPCVVEGDPSFRLAELEQEHDCDLLALGKHGSSMAADLLLGSVTQHLLVEGTVDVLVSTAHGG